jgi:hypothetical protein
MQNLPGFLRPSWSQSVTILVHHKLRLGIHQCLSGLLLRKWACAILVLPFPQILPFNPYSTYNCYSPNLCKCTLTAVRTSPFSKWTGHLDNGESTPSSSFFYALILRNNEAVVHYFILWHAVFHVLRRPRPQDAGTPSFSLLLLLI